MKILLRSVPLWEISGSRHFWAHEPAHLKAIPDGKQIF